MKKFLFLLCIFLLAAGPVCGQEERAGVGFEEKVLDPKADFKGYAELYIHNIDVSKMVVKRVDKDGDMYQRSARGNTMFVIASELGEIFSAELDRAMPVVKQEGPLTGGLKALKGKSVLVLDIHLSYDRTIEDVGFLTQFLSKEKEKLASDKGLTIECSFRDADSGKPLLKLIQTTPFDVVNNDRPFSAKKDKEELKKLFRSWASRVRRILARKRGVVLQEPDAENGYGLVKD